MNRPEEWAGDLVRLMHLYDITRKELAAESGYSTGYVGHALKGYYAGAETRHRLTQAVKRIVHGRGDSFTPLEEWTGDVARAMHMGQFKLKDLAAEAEYDVSHASKALHGKIKNSRLKKNLVAAADRLLVRGIENPKEGET